MADTKEANLPHEDFETESYLVPKSYKWHAHLLEFGPIGIRDRTKTTDELYMSDFQ